MNRADLEAYADAIEAHLTALRGAPARLTPREFALARSLCENGVGLAAVLSALDTRAARETSVSLAACQGLLDRLPRGAEGARARAEEDPAGAGGSHPEVQSRLRALQASLRGRPEAPPAILRRVDELVELLSVATRPNPEHVRRQLQDIDDQVGELAVRWADPAQRPAWEQEAQAALERQRGRVSEEALRAALRRHLEGRAREALSLPRVAIL
jgi:hypothetical protein